MINRTWIGWRSEPTTVEVDAWRVKLFCMAIGETDPTYWDSELAKRAGHPGCPLPPTYLKALEGEHLSSADLLRVMQVPLLGVLHAEQSFEHLAPTYVGDILEIQRTVCDMHDRKEGTLTFIVVDTCYRRDGTDVARSRQTILVRNRISP